jgi:indolepyruvate ferredoxin oxidoreductase beta subunit
MKPMNIYLTGVGGQGIGLISEILLRAADHAGFKVKAVDTHGLAQRGGIVVSHVRIGGTVHSPLIRKGNADLVVALERHEALRGAQEFLKPGATLVYYDVVWQPLDVRLGNASEILPDEIYSFCKANEISCISVKMPDLGDARMQNVALLACIHRKDLVPGVSKRNYIQAMEDLMAGRVLENNLKLFESGNVILQERKGHSPGSLKNPIRGL